MILFLSGGIWANISHGMDLPMDEFDQWLQNLHQGSQPGASNHVDSQNENAINQDANLDVKDDDKTTNALLDARLKIIEQRLKIVKVEPEKVRTEVKEVDGVEVIEILDDDDEDESFCPKTTSTRIKEEMDKEE